MTVENKHAIAMLIDWLKNLAPVLQSMKGKSKTNRIFCVRFSRSLNKLQVIARNCDWFIALFAPVVIGRSNYFGFSTVIL